MTTSLCEIEEDGEPCGKPVKSQGMCGTHYMRWRRHGDPTVIRPKGRPEMYEYVSRPCDQCHGNQVTFRAVEADKPHYCSRACSNRAHKPNRNRRGEDHPNWRGGHVQDGYRYIYVDRADGTRKLVGEGRHVIEQHLGRELRPEETVHHRNGDTLDNRLENLELWSSRHPKGQRVEDLLEFAREILELYG